MSIDLLGIRLLLQLGSALPLPAPFPIMEALRSLEVRSGSAGRDAFQMTLALGKDTPLGSSLLTAGLLDPPNRIVITLLMGAIPEVLIDGIITHTQTSFSPVPGESTLHVTGEDLSLMLDLEEQNRTFEARLDSVIVLELLQPYIARYGLIPSITPTTDLPLPTERMPSQQGTDWAHIQHLAQRNGFVFFVEPMAPGISRAYFGPDAPTGLPQPAVNVGFSGQRASSGPLQGSFDALSSVSPRVSITEPNTGVEIPLTLPNLAAIPPVGRTASALRTTIARTTTGLSAPRAILEGIASAAQGSDPVQLSGEVDGVRYGQVLRSRRLVGVRGGGVTWDGFYKVDEVTHRIRPGEYKQSFSLKRGGFLALSPVVVP